MANESQLTLLEREKTAAEMQTLSRKSIQWLVERIAEIKNIRAVPSQIRAEKNRYTRRFLLGGLYFFYYNPKNKNDLEYYDTFPLVLMLERYSDGFLGLNLHYLPVRYRVALLRKLISYGAIYTDQDEIKRIRITYEILNSTKRFKEFRPCLKRYLNSQIKSRILAVQPNEWDIATYLPVQQFRKAKPNKVWQDSINEIRNS
jgi:virulence-associated protein VapD